VLWLELVPAIAAWLARVIGKLPPGVQALEDWWQGWSAATDPPISKSLPAAGRGNEAATIQEWLTSSPRVLSVESETEDEATACLVASIAQLPRPQRAAAWASALVMHDSTLLGQLAVPNTHLLLVVPGCDPIPPNLASLHRVYRPLARNMTTGPGALRLERPAPGAFKAGLQAMGLEPERAERITRDSSRSLSVTRRLLASRPLPVPHWAIKASGSLKAALLAGAWDEAVIGDREALARLAGKSYEEVQALLTQFSAQQDPPCRMVGSVWRVTSELDLWYALAPHLARTDLDRFSQAATQVLGAPDPGRELPPEERWMANILRKNRPHSDQLRQGLASRVVFLAFLSSAARVSTHLNAEGYARQIVRSLLHNADRERWASIADLLPELAEAAPEEFLASVEFSLDQSDPTVAELFVETRTPFGSSSEHTGLLWALERLAWEPACLARVALLLARLEQIDPGGTLANRPLRSLQGIFQPQMPQTAASPQQRAEVLEMVLRQAPQSGWRILLSFFDSPGIFFQHPKPERRTVPEPPAPTWADVYAVSDLAWPRLIQLASRDGTKWVELLACFGQAGPEQRRSAIAALGSAASIQTGRADLWSALRSYINRNRRFSTSDWAAAEEEMEQAELIYKALEPEDPLEQVAWLFDSPWQIPLLSPPSGEAIGATRIAEDGVRRQAVARLLASGGLADVEALAKAVECPRLVGEALAAVLSEPELDSALNRLLGAQEVNQAELGAGVVLSKFNNEGWAWAEPRFEDARRFGSSPQWLARFLLCLPSCARTWKLAADSAPAVFDAYWRQMRPSGHSTPAEADEMVNRLLEVERPIVALENAAWHRGQIATTTIVRVLEMLPRLLSDQKLSLDRSNTLELARLLDQLDKNGTSEEALALLEFRYARIFTHLRRPTSALHRLLARNPGDFVQFVAWLHPGSGDFDEMAAARARAAAEILKCWHEIPGGSLNNLEGWTTEARRLAVSQGCSRGVDYQIGLALARNSGVDAESGPPEQVSRAVQSALSQDIDCGFKIGLINTHGGVHQRDIESGGSRERQVANRFKLAADRLRNQCPRVASVLERIAESFDDDARRRDDHTELLLGS